MNDLTSSDLIDSPQPDIPIHTLYSCCLDTLKSISLVALPDESFKTYHARLKIWGAGLFTEGPSLDEILEEEPRRYGPLLISLKKTLFSIAVEEGTSSLSETPRISIDLATVVFLKSRQPLDGNYDTDLRLEHQTKWLLDHVSVNHIATLACERRLPHLVNASQMGTIEPLTLQKLLSQDLAPSTSNQTKTRKDRSFTNQGTSSGFINRLSENIPAAKEVSSLLTEKEDTMDRNRAASSMLAEQSLKEDYNASFRQSSEVYYNDYHMYLGEFVESLFDLIPSIRGIRRTRLLEAEVPQSNAISPSSDLLKQATPRILPEPGLQSDRDGTASQIVKKGGQLRPPSWAPLLKSSVTGSHELAFQIYNRFFREPNSGDVNYLDFGGAIYALGACLQGLENITNNIEGQIPDSLWRLDGANTMAAIFETLLEVTGDFARTLHECESLLSDKLMFQRSATGFVRNMTWVGPLGTIINDLRQRVSLHAAKIDFIVRPFELHLLHRIHHELQHVKQDVAPLKGILIQDTDQSIQRKSPSHRNRRVTIPIDLAKRFEKAFAASKPDSIQAQDHLPLREGFDTLVFHLASSTVKFKPSPGPGQNIPEEIQFVNLLKSGWIMEKLKSSDYLHAAGTESLWADFMKELEDQIIGQLSRFDTGELEPPPLDVMLRLPMNCFSIWVYEEPRPRPPVLAEHRPLEEKILELVLPSLYDGRRSTLTVFRKSDVNFRLVSTTKDEQNKDFHSEESMDINMNSDRFIPAYATSYNGDAVNNNVLLCNSQGQELKWYNFQDLSAVAEVQRALTGYSVVHSMSNISWHVVSSKFNRNKAISGMARLQFWHLKPLPKLLPSLDGTTLVGSVSSVRASVRSPTISTLPLSGSTVTAPMPEYLGDNMGLKPPVLIIFTMCERRYTFFHIQMDRSVSAKPLMYGNSRKTCVLIQSSSKKWNFRRLSAQLENEQGLDSWNLACFRYPEHPAFQNLEQLTNVKFMRLDFETIEQSQEFCNEFELLGNLRDVKILDHERTRREKKYMATNYRQR